MPRPSTQDRLMIASTHEVLEMVAAKWKVDAIYLLARGAHRYGELYAHLLGISKKVLTETLRALERDGFVQRRLYAEVPVRVEYSLTPLGWSLTEPLLVLCEWADANRDQVAQARERFDPHANEHADQRLRLVNLKSASAACSKSSARP
jgi:DNA-binding HxlR family transcriptional regulator